MRNYLFFKRYVTSEGVVSHNVFQVISRTPSFNSLSLTIRGDFGHMGGVTLTSGGCPTTCVSLRGGATLNPFF